MFVRNEIKNVLATKAFVFHFGRGSVLK